MAKKHDKQKIFARIIAGVLVAAMVLGACATVISILLNK